MLRADGLLLYLAYDHRLPKQQPKKKCPAGQKNGPPRWSANGPMELIDGRITRRFRQNQ
jgi:hypothetical protein